MASGQPLTQGMGSNQGQILGMKQLPATAGSQSPAIDINADRQAVANNQITSDYVKWKQNASFTDYRRAAKYFSWRDYVKQMQMSPQAVTVTNFQAYYQWLDQVWAQTDCTKLQQDYQTWKQLFSVTDEKNWLDWQAWLQQKQAAVQSGQVQAFARGGGGGRGGGGRGGRGGGGRGGGGRGGGGRGYSGHGWGRNYYGHGNRGKYHNDNWYRRHPSYYYYNGDYYYYNNDNNGYYDGYGVPLNLSLIGPCRYPLYDKYGYLVACADRPWSY